MRRVLLVPVFCIFGLVAASQAAPAEKYTALVMPSNVSLGMSRATVQPVRGNAKKLDLAVGSRNTNATVLTEIKADAVPSICYQYHFIEDQLRAVTQGILHGGRRDEQAVRSIHNALARDLVKKSDETILRLDEQMNQVLVNAELWRDEKSGAEVYFVDTTNELTVITFDPRCFSKRDFFMSPDELPQIAPALEKARKTVEESKKLKK